MKIKKPKFWDYKHPNLFAYILYPLALLIRIIVYLNKKQKQKKHKIKTICIGNIYVGGTGKTSLCIKIKKILDNHNIKSCFIKKYYKNQIDEQKLLKKNGELFLSSNRINAIEQAEKNNYEIAILDDGIQDKSINCDLSFVCFNNINWIGNGMTIPAGPLRENINNLKNYNHLFLNGNLENLENIKKDILKINSNINIHVGKYIPTNIDEFNKKDHFLVFSGIGNHKTFVSMLKNNGLNVIRDIEYPDHYIYSEKDVDEIISQSKNLNCQIITTEKDGERLQNFKSNKLKIIKSELKIIDEDKLIKFII